MHNAVVSESLPVMPVVKAEDFVGFLLKSGTVKYNGKYFVGECPAHTGPNQHLRVRDGERGAVVRCLAGCSARQIQQWSLHKAITEAKAPEPARAVLHTETRSDRIITSLKGIKASLGELFGVTIEYLEYVNMSINEWIDGKGR